MFGVVIRSLDSKLEQSKKQCMEINVSMQENQEIIEGLKSELLVSWFQMNEPLVTINLAEKINFFKEKLVIVKEIYDAEIDTILSLENSIKKYKDYIRVSGMKKANINLDVLSDEEVANYEAVHDVLIICPWLVADTEEEKERIMVDHGEFEMASCGPINYQEVYLVPEKNLKKRLLK